MAETITDPDALALSRGWYDDSQGVEGPFIGEIGDLCEDVFGNVDGYTVAALWSNMQNTCVFQGQPSAGGCPAGEKDDNGVCVPAGSPSAGCSSSGAGAAPLFALFAFLTGTSFRRWSRSRRSRA